MRINRPEHHTPLYYEPLWGDIFPDQQIKLHRIDFPDRVSSGIVTARSQLASTADALFAYDGYDVDVHTSSSYEERLRRPLHCEHGIGSPFVSASIEPIEDFYQSNEWRMNKTGARIYELSIDRDRIIVPYYCPYDQKHHWLKRVREVLVVGDISADDVQEIDYRRNARL